jgi:predicted metal-dependent phosphoesterase TrpH
MSLAADDILKSGRGDGVRAVGRPDIARALVAKGFVENTNDAFDKWLGRGKPAFVPRVGVSPEAVFAEIHAARGLASLAHPVLSQVDDRIPAYAEAGLDALEAYHSRHDQATSSRYRALAQSLGLLVTGGSDFHGSEAHGGGAPGSVFLPGEEYERLRARYNERSAASRATASGSSTSS